MSQDNVETARQVLEAVNRRDLEAFGAPFAADAEIVPIRSAVDGTVYRGPDAAAKMFAAQEESWDDLSVENEEIRHGGDWVLVLGRIRGRGRTSGADFDVSAASVLYFREGLITKLHVYTDRTEALQAVGLSG